jgi:Flp pilus assembly pilin Flp
MSISITTNKKEGSKMLLTSHQNEGQGLVEYALIISFVVLVVIVLLFVFGAGVGEIYSNIVNNV